MVKEIGYDLIMVLGVAFAVFTASDSISEEIEGRTAITVMSKPVSRYQFLVGKFLGILAAALLMTAMLGWFFNGVMWFKLWFDRELPGDPAWMEPLRQAWRGAMGEPAANFILGSGVWFANAIESMPGLIFGFCQVMVLLAIAVALATRLPMIVNMVTCLLIFFLGHLTHVLVQVSQARFALVNFMARFFETILPGLEYFDPGPLIVRDIPLEPRQFSIYIGSVVLYAALYSIIALVFGLILFEDRDLA
jgi:ABC-type transport system involved in multi-copper enzyme maturation permease subunit